SGKDTSHLFSERDDYKDFHFRIEAKISDKGNSGQYFRTEFGPGYPKGYEAQINSTFPTDPVRTGSLYNFVLIRKMLVPPDTWFTQEVIAKGNHIVIKVNGVKTVDYVDFENTYMKGRFALQQHAPSKGGPESVLRVARERADAAGVAVQLLKANLVDLRCLDDSRFNYAACLFSTLGMIAGAAERRRVVDHVFRLLKPGGKFVLHVHNRWFNLWNRQARGWLI